MRKTTFLHTLLHNKDGITKIHDGKSKAGPWTNKTANRLSEFMGHR